jgi:hypothetical protein
MRVREPYRRVFLWDEYAEPNQVEMQFRLTYEGELLANNSGRQDLARAPHKHAMRKIFHQQLKRLWGIHPVLKELATVKMYHQRGITLLEHTAANFHQNGYRFVPLVTRELCLICKLEILMLRHGEPGGVISAGDIDNRVKTLLDALRKPRSANELGGATPADDEDPFFCLLEDDGLVTHLAVETDTLLEPVTGKDSDVRLVIDVTLGRYGGPAINEAFA